MAARLNGKTLGWIGALNREGASAGMGDGPLLERFLASPGPEGEAAFEALVRRHGPMVLALCRGVLRDDHEADDAFQATFLVLARRAATIRDRGHLAPWLGRVARRVALRARKEAARRRDLEGRRADFEAEAGEAAGPGPVAVEAAAMVRAEVDRLPEADRLLMRLTYWQGKTYEEASSMLSLPIGTVRSRLARARRRLRDSLSRLGLAPALAGFPPAVQPSDALISLTVRAATRYAGTIPATTAVGVVPAAVAALVEGELSMTTFPWKSIAALVLVGGTVAAGAVTLARRAPETATPPAPTPAASPARIEPGPGPAAEADVKIRLANAGIEEGKGNAPASWSKGAAIPGVTYVWSRDTAHGGKASLGLKKSAQRYFPIAQWWQEVDREGKAPRLKVSAWVKADKAGKAILDAQFLDGDGQQTHAWVAYIGAKEANDPPVTHDWKRYEGVVAIPPGTKKILIAPQIYGPGTVWFDDLDAEYTDAPETDPTGS